MAENPRSESLQQGMRPEVAKRRIGAFGKHFGEGHLYFAQHAAFPPALTPDLLYHLWANFRQTINSEKLNVPWIAVADLLLSGLCDEVGHELYEMNTGVRALLLNDLKGTFGDQRIKELSDFLLVYVQQYLNSHDPDIRDLANVQRWTALSYTQPKDAVNELASVLHASLKQHDRSEQMRIASLIQTLAEPLAGFVPLLTYARGIEHLARGDIGRAEISLNDMTRQELQTLGISLPIPEQIIEKAREIQKSAQLTQPKAVMPQRIAPQQVRKALRTMFIGLGGTGNEVVRRVKQEMLIHGYDLPIFQYLVLDTVPFYENPGMSPLMRLRNGEEYLYVGGYNPNEIVKQIDNWPVISHWWGTRELTNLVNVDEGAGQMRAVGRMGFFRHFKDIQERLARMVYEVMSSSNREMALLHNYDIPTDKAPIIYLVFSLCGGTGSSLFFDVAYVLRKLFVIQPTIVGLAVLPGPFMQGIHSIPQQERIQANTYATLQELERLHNMALGQEARPNGKDIWDMQYSTNFRVSSPDLPFDYIYLIDDMTTKHERYSLEQIFGLMSQAIFWLSGPTTAVRFWERAKNLSSNTLAAGGYPDISGRLRLSKYSSLGIGTAVLDWRIERVQGELEYLILKKLQTMSPMKPALSNWLSNADSLINKVSDEPGVNPIPGPSALKPVGTFRDRASVDEMLESYTTKYNVALASLSRSIRWSRCKERYLKEAANELETIFRKSLIERGPVAALQEMETIKESLVVVLNRLDELDGEANVQAARLSEEYERTRRSSGSVSVFFQSIGNGVRRIYGFRSTSVERELRILGENLAHQRYLWYLNRFRMYLCRDVRKSIIEPTIAYADKLRASLDGVGDALETWQDRIRLEAPLQMGADGLPHFEAKIRIRPHQSEQEQVADAIKRGDIRPDALVMKVLRQSFDTWPKQGGSVLDDLRTAMSSIIIETLQRLAGDEHLLDQMLEPDAWRQRELFLRRADCMWSFTKDANLQILSHLESIDILGYGVEKNSHGQISRPQELQVKLDALLKKQDIAPELVPTDISSELIYMKTLHGLPVSLIRSMPELHHAYQVMNTVRVAPYLHLDYRDQVRAGYGPLTNSEMTSKQIIDTWIEMAGDIEGSMGQLATLIKKVVYQYAASQQNSLQEMVQVNDEYDHFFEFVGGIEEVIMTQNKTPVVSEMLIKLSDLVGLLHSQGWVAINPTYGTHFDESYYEKIGTREEAVLPPDRIVEVIRRGYIWRKPNEPDRIRRARVIVSIDSRSGVRENS